MKRIFTKRLFGLIVALLLLPTCVLSKQPPGKPFFGQGLDWTNPINEGTVGHWAFNEGAGSRVNDLSGYQNHGQINGATWTGEGLSFNGSSDYVSLGNALSLYPSSAITLACWVKFNSVAGTQRMIDSYTGADYAWVLGMGWTASTPEVYVYLNSSHENLDSTGTVSVNIWYFLTATYDSSNGYLAIYKDGFLDDDTTIAGGHPLVQADDNVVLGARSSLDSGWLNGVLANVQIWNRALSSAEIKSLYDDGEQLYLQPVQALSLVPTGISIPVLMHFYKQLRRE